MLLNYAISAVQACLLSSLQVDNQRHEATDPASCAGSRACAVAPLSVRTTQIYERY